MQVELGSRKYALMVAISDEDVDRLKDELDGELTIVNQTISSSPSWNGLLQGPHPYITAQVPAYIVNCATPADVSKAVQFGREHNLKVSNTSAFCGSSHQTFLKFTLPLLDRSRYPADFFTVRAILHIFFVECAAMRRQRIH